MSPESRLDAARFPVPENNITVPVTATDPFSVWREADLACIPCDRVSREPLVSGLSEVIGAIYQYLIIE
jgi:hypothetical protein